MFNPIDQQKTAQLVSDVLMLSLNGRTPKGENLAAHDLINFCAWVIAENQAGRVVDLNALTNGSPCTDSKTFCPIRGNA